MKSILLYISFSLCALLSMAQQYPDRHSTSSKDAWLSCTTSPSPNTNRGASHWIQYDLGATYVLSEVTLWNYNHPANLDYGIRDIVIDISSDGSNWTEVAQASVSISQGSAFYEGENIVDLGGLAADYVLITILNNHGGSCSGFSEIRISSAAVLPIELSSQSAECTSNGEAISIEWQTTNEVGNDYFTIEKSNKGVDWFDIADLHAQGSQENGHLYSYLDYDIIESQYYRLKNTDIDGKLQYFDIMAASCQETNTIEINVNNPFTESLIVNYKSLEHGGEITFIVESLDGKEVFKFTSNGSQTNPLSIPSSEWITGTYIISIKQQNQLLSKKVIKI